MRRACPAQWIYIKNSNLMPSDDLKLGPLHTKMRIAFIGGRLSRRASGVKVVVERLSKALENQGHIVRVFGHEDKAWRDGDNRAWTGAPATAFRIVGPKSFGYAPGLKKAIQAFSPDVVHTHGLWMFGSLVSSRLARAGTPNVVSPHGMLDGWALEQSRWKKRIFFSLLEKPHLGKASSVHVLTESEAASVQGFGLKSPIAVIPNGVDLPTQKENPSIPKWRTNLPAEIRVLLYLGRIHTKKNLAPLIDALAMTKLSQWHLVVAGPDQDGHQGKLEALSSRLCTTDSVHFIGAQFDREKDSTIAAADAFVLPSLSEGLPMAVLEAWAWRLPVLMSTYCNLPEGFSNGAAIDTGTTPESIARALIDLATRTDAERTTIGTAGFDLVERSYTWDRVAKQFASLYQSCREGSQWPSRPSPEKLESAGE
jgi:poly(glycerol-phosphate) alpha-glucosyltransferase